ncbi:MATE family efflux transporter [Candidatus Saccharibacteria bacterium]|nr:MATE family efflux transporter [Candidatus Saccharibacteria bacterium]
MKNENNYLLTVPVQKLLLKFAIPCVLSMLVGALYNIVDQIFIGNSTAGTAGIMATTLVYPFTVVALAIALLIGDGTAALYSVSLGRKNTTSAKKSIGNALLALIVSSLVLTALGFIFMEPIMNFLGSAGYSPECQAFARDYLTIILLGFPFYIFTSGAAPLIRASGAPTYSMISTVIGAIINLIFDPIMIFGLNIGIQGAAIATIAGQIISALIVAAYFIHPPRNKKLSTAESTLTSELVKITPKSFRLDKKVFSESLKLGISSFITQLSIAIITVVANNVVGAIGGIHATDAGGALGIVFKVFAIVISFVVGVAVGGQPIIGFNYGANRPDRVLATFKYIIITNTIISIIAMALFEFAPSLIVSIFGGHADDLSFYQNFAAMSFRVYLGGIVLCCLTKSAAIFLQSIERPYHAMLLSLMRDVILLVPAVCFFGFSYGLEGMLWAGPVTDIISFIVTCIVLYFPVHTLIQSKQGITKK